MISVEINYFKLTFESKKVTTQHSTAWVVTLLLYDSKYGIEYGAEFEEELHRVIVHGLLHLIGYDDHTPEEEKEIHQKEDYYLKFRESVWSKWMLFMT